MEKKKLLNHAKGQNHAGKTNWERIQKNVGKPMIDPENPELANKAGKRFTKPAKNQS